MNGANILTTALGLGFTFVGIFAFVYPGIFFNLLPEYYGSFNLHFVKDAGIAFFSSGLLLLLSLPIRRWRKPLTLGGALFVSLHGMFHIQMLVMGMAPTLLDILIETVVIISPAVLSTILFILRLREKD